MIDQTQGKNIRLKLEIPWITAFWRFNIAAQFWRII
jgi:hypothetical protein